MKRSSIYTTGYTRQQDRASMREIAKAMRGQRKVYAMKDRRPGGAAAVR